MWPVNKHSVRHRVAVKVADSETNIDNDVDAEQLELVCSSGESDPGEDVNNDHSCSEENHSNDESIKSHLSCSKEDDSNDESVGSYISCLGECRCGVLEASYEALDDMVEEHPDKFGVEFLEEIYNDIEQTHSGYHGGDKYNLRDMTSMLRGMRDRSENEMDCWDNLVEADELDIAHRKAQVDGLDLDEFEVEDDVVLYDTELIRLVDDIAVLVQRCREVIKYIKLMSGDDYEIVPGVFAKLLVSSNMSTEHVEEAIRQEISLMIDGDPKRLLLPEDERVACHVDCPRQHSLSAAEMASVCWLPYAHLLCTQARCVYDDLEEVAEQLDEADDVQHGLRAQTTPQMLEFVMSMLNHQSAMSIDAHEDDGTESQAIDKTIRQTSRQPTTVTLSCTHSTQPSNNLDDSDVSMIDAQSVRQILNQSTNQPINQPITQSTLKRKRQDIDDQDLVDRDNAQSRLITLIESIQKHRQPVEVDDTNLVEGHEIILDLLRDRMPDEDVIRLIIQFGVHSHEAATQFLSKLHNQIS